MFLDVGKSSDTLTNPIFKFRGFVTNEPAATQPVDFAILTRNNLQINASSYASDDRIKHNEKPIEQALETIRVLEPYRYFKTNQMYDASHNFALDASGQPIDNSGNVVRHIIEQGLIAQDLLKIDALKDFVNVPEDLSEKYSVNYNSIFVHSIKALQELDIAHTQTKTELEETKQKLTELESLLQSALSRITSLETQSTSS